MPNLGQTLLQRRDINLIQLNLALDFRVFYGGRLGTNLLELGIISEETLTEALSEHLGVPGVGRLALMDISPEVIQKLPREVAYRAQAVPFRVANDLVHIAFTEPRNDRAVAEVKRAIGGRILVHVAPEFRIQEALEKYYQLRMEPRMKTLAAKVVSRHELRPPGPVFTSRAEPPALPGPLEAFRFDEWVTDEGRTLLEHQEGVRKPVADGKVTLSIQKISLLLEEAQTRDEIADLALSFAQTYLKRVALFVLRKDIGFGWDGRGLGLTRERVKTIVVPLSEPSVFQTLVESQGHFLGAVPETPVNQQFLLALGDERPSNILLLPLTIGGITFGLIYGDNGNEGITADAAGINELQVMISRVSIAFERLIIVERQRAMNANVPRSLA